jgi:hypothetical protein
VSSLAVAGVFHWLLNLAILLLLNFANGDLADVTALAAGFVLAAVVLWGCARLRPELSQADTHQSPGTDLAAWTSRTR